MNALIVFTTAPSLSVARKIAKILLHLRLAACVHLASRVESHYWWKGKIEKAFEIPLTIKTSEKSLQRLMRTLKKIHPYEVPEILVVRVDSGDLSYVKWLIEETDSNLKRI